MGAAHTFDLDVAARGDETVVSLSGEIDVDAAADLRAALTDLVQSGHDRLVVDLADVTLLDTTGLGVLVGTMKRVVSHPGGTFRVRRPSSRVRTVLSLTGLDGVIDVTDA